MKRKGKIHNILKISVGLQGGSYPVITTHLKFTLVPSQTDFFGLVASLDMCSLASETAPELLCDVHSSVYIQLPEEKMHPSSRWCHVL